MCTYWLVAQISTIDHHLLFTLQSSIYLISLFALSYFYHVAYLTLCKVNFKYTVCSVFLHEICCNKAWHARINLWPFILPLIGSCLLMSQFDPLAHVFHNLLLVQNRKHFLWIHFYSLQQPTPAVYTESRHNMYLPTYPHHSYKLHLSLTQHACCQK